MLSKRQTSIYAFFDKVSDWRNLRLIQTRCFVTLTVTAPWCLWVFGWSCLALGSRGARQSLPRPQGLT